MSDIPNDPTADLDGPSAADLSAVEDSAALAEAEAEDNDLEPDTDSEDLFVDPGADGPEGTGIEGADDALVEDTDQDDELDAPDVDGEFDADPVAAAEQGNRPEDEMVTDED